MKKEKALLKKIIFVLILFACITATKAQEAGSTYENPIVLTDTSSNVLAPHGDLNLNYIYYSFTPTEEQEGFYNVSTCGKIDKNTIIEIYLEDNYGYTTIAYSDDECDEQSQTYFYAELGITYYMYIFCNDKENFYFYFTKFPDGYFCQSPIVLTDTSSNILVPHYDLSTDIIYYMFTPTDTQEGAYQLSTCNKTSQDTKIIIQLGTCDSSTQIAVSDDECSRQSKTYFYAESGMTYIFKWYNKTGINNYNFSFVKSPEGIICEVPIELNDTSSNILAPFSDFSIGAIYYKFTPTIEQEGIYKISTCGKTNQETSVAIFLGNCDSNITYSGGNCFLQSYAYFYAESGNTYTFRWINHSSFNSYNWSFTKLETLIRGVTCQMPIILTDTSNNIIAPHGDLHNETIYYSFTPTEEQEGNYEISTCGKTYAHTNIKVYKGNCNNLTQLANSGNNCGFQSKVRIYFERGQTYTIKLENNIMLNNYFNYNFSFTKCPKGFSCQDPIYITDTSNSIIVRNGDYANWGFYYSFTPTEEQEGFYKVSTCEKTNLDTYLTIYKNNCYNNNQIAYSDDLCGLQSQVFFHAEYGQTYIINCFSFNTTANYSFSFLGFFERGYFCKFPIILTDTSSNILVPHRELFTENIYYTFTPTEGQEGYYQVSTCNKTEQDTEIIIYSGTCDNLAQIKYSDNACNMQSNALFYAESGMTYFFKLKNNSGKNNYNFSFLKAQEGIICQNPIVLTDTSSNILAQYQALGVQTIYYSFTPSDYQEGYYQVSTCDKTEYNTRISINSGVCNNLNQIVFSDDECSLQSMGYFYAESGVTYTIIMANLSGKHNYNFSFVKAPEGIFCEIPIELTDTSSNILAQFSDFSVHKINYLFTPSIQQEGYYIISTCGKTDQNSQIEVYTGECNTLDLVPVTETGCSYQNQSLFYAEYGISYKIIIHNFEFEDKTNLNFSFIKAPEGAECEIPIELTDTSSNILTSHGDFYLKYIYYSFTPTIEQEGDYRISTCEKTDVNTTIWVYSEFCYNSNNSIQSYDDCSYQSNLYFHANAGITYFLVLICNNESSNYYFSFIKAEEGTTCQYPILLTDTLSNILAPHQDLYTNKIYYSFTPTEGQEDYYELSTCGKTNQKSKVRIFTSLCDQISEISCLHSNCNNQELVYFYAGQGITYFFEWENYSGKNNYNFSFRKAPEGLYCSNPIHLIDTSNNILTSNLDLKQQTIYYNFTPTEEQEGYYQISTCDKTSQNTYITLYSGDCDNLIPITYSDNNCNVQSLAYFYAQYGLTYTFKWQNLTGINNFDWSFTSIENPDYVNYINFNLNPISLNVDEQKNLKIIKLPYNAAYNSLNFSSRNTDIVSVDQYTGKVTGLRAGTTYVIATLTTPNTTIIDSCKIFVRPLLVTGIELNQATLTIEGGQTVTLYANVTPLNASNVNIGWESDSIDIASVNNNGEVKGHREGIAIITATTEDGNFTASCTVTVISNEFAINEIKVDEPCNIYPNPTSDKLNIESSILIKTISMYNIDGKLIEKNTLNTLTSEIDMSKYQSGTYLFMMIELFDKNIIRKTVIKK